eukprot:TRINITY_DN52442_c0_g1_i1.p1 TRINITY_DN52442_c0_g1~~TRINITY_DN52442_c0_g1_i1.p1  ORF type:complete len:133 (-),score=27.15 TRINITY_DN52442_c0_g1_i1:63-461(-)
MVAERLANMLYLTHALTEFGLGLIKLRGHYAHEDPASKPLHSQLYVRHHAAALLSLALLGYLVWRRGLVSSETGKITSASFALFHVGAVLANAYAWLQGAVQLGKILIPHMPFALGFVWHASAVSSADEKTD